MRFIGKKSVCAAAIELPLAFYFVRNRIAQISASMTKMFPNLSSGCAKLLGWHPTDLLAAS